MKKLFVLLSLILVNSLFSKATNLNDLIKEINEDAKTQKYFIKKNIKGKFSKTKTIKEATKLILNLAKKNKFKYDFSQGKDGLLAVQVLKKKEKFDKFTNTIYITPKACFKMVSKKGDNVLYVMPYVTQSTYIRRHGPNAPMQYFQSFFDQEANKFMNAVFDLFKTKKIEYKFVGKSALPSQSQALFKEVQSLCDKTY